MDRSLAERSSSPPLFAYETCVREELAGESVKSPMLVVGCEYLRRVRRAWGGRRASRASGRGQMMAVADQIYFAH